MMPSMFVAIGGLRNQQMAINATANNIANSATVGYKSQRASFEEMMAHTLRGASAPVAGGAGGTSPIQMGLGMNLQAIQTITTQGALQSTGQWSDMGINGEGYFIVAKTVDVDAGGTLPAVPEIKFTRAGNFATDAAGWLMTQNGDYLLGVTVAAVGPPLVFNEELNGIQIPTDAKNIAVDRTGIITYDLGGRQTAGQVMMAKFPNPAGLARNGNNNLLDTANSGIFDPTVNAPTPNGDPFWSAPDANGLGTVSGGALEMSNVDLGEQFTNLIVSQRSFQANSRIVTTSDEMLQELVNLKR